MSWLLAHWELKLVSLVVAVALWTYTSGQVRVERQVLVELTPAQVLGLPSDLQAAAVEPGEFAVVLSVPTSKLDAMREQVLRPQIELPRGRREPGILELALTGRALGLDSDIRVVRTEPADVRSVRIRLSAQGFATVAAEPPPVVGLPSGIAAEVRLDRTRVEVGGPQEQVAAFEAGGDPLRFQPVRLDGIDPALAAPREERVNLRAHDGQPAPVQPVVATITLRPARTSTAVLRVPVSILLAPVDAGRWRIDGDPPVAEVRLTGPEAVVRGLRPEDISAWIDLHLQQLQAGRSELPVQISAPSAVKAEAAAVAVSLVQVP